MAKKAVLKKEEPQADIHRRINSPISLRKDVLSAAINLTEILRAYEEIKKLREHKVQYLTKLKKITNQIKKEINKIKIDEAPLKEYGIKLEKPKIKLNTFPKKFTPKVTKPEPVTHADKLDDEIEALKRKLATI